MAGKKGSKKQVKRTTVELNYLKDLEENQIKSVSNDRVKAEFIKRFMTPFDDIITELESKKEEIEDLKSEIEDLAN